jgi:putative tryptophan/tyrosine transport system substrate-binding protein
MRRREFVTLIGAALCFPFVARAQEKGRVYQLGNLSRAPRNEPHHVVLFEELQRQGFVEGQNLVADAQGYGLRESSLQSMRQNSSKAKSM